MHTKEYREAWEKFAAAAVQIETGLGTDLRIAAEYADAMMVEWEKRFGEEDEDEETTEDRSSPAGHDFPQVV